MQNNMYPQGPNGNMGNGGYGQPMDGNHYAMQQMQGGRQGPNNGMGQGGYNPNPGMGNQMGGMGGVNGNQMGRQQQIGMNNGYSGGMDGGFNSSDFPAIGNQMMVGQNNGMNGYQNALQRMPAPPPKPACDELPLLTQLNGELRQTGARGWPVRPV